MSDLIRVRIKPFRAIGGYGGPGDEVMMSREEVDQYLHDGYIEILPPEGDPPPAPPTSPKTLPSKEMEDKSAHVIMKPEVKRGRRRKK